MRRQWLDRPTREEAPPMDKDKPRRSKDASGNEQLWAVHVQGPDDMIAMTSRATADQHAAEINTLYEAQSLGREGTLPRMRAVVVPSPWSALEHWRHCAETQEQWIEELEARLRASASRHASHALLVPGDEQIARAWFGEEYEPGLSTVPSRVRDYTVALLGSLPMRALGSASASRPVRSSTKAELLAQSIRRALPAGSVQRCGPDQGKADLEPVHLREVVQLLRQWRVIDRVEMDPGQLVNDEMCNQDYHAAQMASPLDATHPLDIWRKAYAAALNRCSL